MRVLVTGASGSIGSAVCAALLDRGDQVVGLSRDPERARSREGRVEWHAWRPVDEPAPAEALAGADAVINLVGEEINQRLTGEAKRRIYDSRVRATENLVAGIRAAGEAERPKALVSQAAVGYYGDSGERELDEDAPAGGDFLAGLVRDWEAAAREAEDLGVRVATVRMAPVLNPEHGLLKELLLPFRLGLGGPLAGGNWYLSWIHRKDAIALLVWAAEEERVSGALNGCAPNPVTNKEFSRALGRVLGRPAVLPVPRLAVAVLRGGELARAVTSSIRAVPRRPLELGFAFKFPLIEPALRDLLGR
ncbi:MAG TPA: TIGR01777 family oxidoreductase [Solirubrobacterales bacterium]|jgi:hypothetical protein